MASIRKVNGKWLAEVRLKGKYKSKTFDKQGQADSWAKDEEHKIKNSGDIVYGKTLGDAFKRYAIEESPKKKGARWEIIRLNKIGRDEIAAIQIADLTAEDFEGLIKRMRESGLSDASIRRELQCVSPVLTACRKWKWMEHYPLKDVKFPKKSAFRKKTYSDEQIARVLLALGYEGKAVNQRQKIAVSFLLAIETAMRHGELFKLDWLDINLEKRSAHLEDTKNGESRDVPLSMKAVELFESLGIKEDGRVFNFPQASAGVIFRRALQIAGIEDYTFHDTRHTALTRIAKKRHPVTGEKMDVLTLCRISGHKDPRMLLGYFNPTTHDIAQMLD